jgi:RHS repeat-associated protein
MRMWCGAPELDPGLRDRGDPAPFLRGESTTTYASSKLNRAGRRAARYDSGLSAHKCNRPAHKRPAPHRIAHEQIACSRSRCGNLSTFHLSPVNSHSQTLSGQPTLQHNHARYDGDNLIEETNSSGAVMARYSDGLNVDEPLAMLRSGATSFYNADGLGTITSLANTAGSLAQTYTFDSFGNQTASSGSLTNSFQYTAREFDSETFLYYYRARYYDSTTGRFVTEDPNGFAGGDVNFYSYVGNSVTKLVDSLGLKPGDKYKSIDCAALNALGDIFPQTKKDGNEHGGFIYQNPDGTFSYTDPTTGTPTSIPAPKFFTIPIPVGATPAGWYHTHPYVPGYNGQVFSDGDKWTSEHLNNSNSHPIVGPGYLGTPTNSMKKYVPAPGHPYGGNTVPLPAKPCDCN